MQPKPAHSEGLAELHGSWCAPRIACLVSIACYNSACNTLA